MLAVLALALGLAAGVAVGRWTGDEGPAATGDGGAGPCPAPRSPEGAVRAAVCFDVLLYGLEGRPQGEQRAGLAGALANPAAVDRFLALLAAGAPAGGRAAAGVLTTRPEAYREDTTQVFLWVAVARVADPLAGTSDPASVTSATWSTDAVVVTWDGRRWALGDVDRAGTAPPAGGRNLAPDWSGAPYARR